MQRKLLAVLIPLACSAHAEPGARLKEITVTATRVEADVGTVAATVTTVDREALARRLPRDEADLFRDEPDVAFARDARRFGATRPNIRGLENNRVIQMVDGVRLSDFYNGGGPTNFTMAAPLPVMPDFMKRVEILRGPASSLYGSDAMGGVVGYLTLDPADVLKEGERAAFRYRIGHYGANQGLSNTVLGAFRGEAVEALIGISHLKANETDNQGDVGTTATTRTRPNPQDSEDLGLLAKLSVRPAAGHKLGITVEGRDQNVRTDVRRLVASLPKVTSMQGDDNNRRLRVSLDWEYKVPMDLYDRLSVKLYHQDSDTENYNFQLRTNTNSFCSAATGNVSNCTVEQDFFFTQESIGAAVQMEKTIDTGTLTHFLTYGADLGRVQTEQMRDARIWRTSGPPGGISLGTPGTHPPHKVLAGDAFPLRDFAIGQTDSIGVFIQDEIGGLASGKLTLTPGLRYDWRKLEPKVDALAQAVLTANNRQAVTQRDGAFSPKLAALWRFTPALAAWGHVARGFRAPNYEEVNGSFRNTTQSYGVSPNPDLKPETSIGVELGLRATGAMLRGQVSVFDNRYRNFIESQRLNCPSDPRCIPGLNNTNMAVNLTRVNIKGWEARAAWDFLPGWKADGALAYARGDDKSSGRPLDSIEPLRYTLGLAREAGAWGAELRLRGAAKKDRVNDFSGTTYSPWFRPPAYTVGDVSAWWQFRKAARLTASIHNLTDEKYWLWSDIRQADARNPAGVDFYSQPGRTFSLALLAEF